jgi:hypothetical protein
MKALDLSAFRSPSEDGEKPMPKCLTGNFFHFLE